MASIPSEAEPDWKSEDVVDPENEKLPPPSVPEEVDHSEQDDNESNFERGVKDDADGKTLSSDEEIKIDSNSEESESEQLDSQVSEQLSTFSNSRNVELESNSDSVLDDFEPNRDALKDSVEKKKEKLQNKIKQYVSIVDIDKFGH